MCGIAGVVGEGAQVYAPQVRQMMDALSHRGPDGEGIYVSPSGMCVLGHRRLAILDLSDFAAQPMLSEDRRWAFVYNGECYNYLDLRDDLVQRGESFTSSGDTEVLLRALSRDESRALPAFNAMFALALWDEKERSLLLARDRYGQKPLYLFRKGSLLFFASELRALLATGLVPRKIDPRGLFGYLAYGAVQEPHTIVDGVSIVPAASYLRREANGRESIASYWRPSSETRALSSEELRDLFVKAVGRHLLSDAPIASFLSGGIDSSAIVAAAAHASSQPISTLSIVFPDQPAQSEAPFAEMMATKLGTSHHAIPLVGSEFLRMLPHALNAMDQPTLDAVNTYTVSRAAREHGFKVALSGLGGDELFGGYALFQSTPRFARARRMLGPLAPLVTHALPVIARHTSFSRKLDRAVSLAEQPKGLLAAYLTMRRAFSNQSIGVLAPELASCQPCDESSAEYNELTRLIKDRSAVDAIGLLEMRMYMGQILLRDSDVMGMQHGLEIRVPFLDTEFSSAVMALPSSAREPHPLPKWRLIEAMGDWLPRSITHRAKQGFLLPFSSWMQSDIKASVELGLEQLTSRVPLFHAPAVHGLWQQFLRKPETVGWSRPWLLYVLGNYLEHHRLAL